MKQVNVIIDDFWWFFVWFGRNMSHECMIVQPENLTFIAQAVFVDDKQVLLDSLLSFKKESQLCKI